MKEYSLLPPASFFERKRLEIRDTELPCDGSFQKSLLKSRGIKQSHTPHAGGIDALTSITVASQSPIAGS